MTQKHLNAVCAALAANLPEHVVSVEWPGAVVVRHPIEGWSWWFGDANITWGGTKHGSDDMSEPIKCFETKLFPNIDEPSLIAAELACHATLRPVNAPHR